jgi:outer membrane biosynthesis protein TonB
MDAATENPVTEAPPEVQPSPPVPAVTQPKPAISQTPSPSLPTKTAPALKPVTPSLVMPSVQKPISGLDLDALANTVRAVTPAPKHASSAAKGPSQSQTDLVMRPAVGAGRGSSVDIMQAISARLARLWNPNCGVEGAANIVVKVRLTLSPSGQLIRANLVDEQRVLQSGDAVLQAAGTRALTAVARAAPYAELPAETYADWKSFVVSFDARQICRGY